MTDDPLDNLEAKIGALLALQGQMGPTALIAAQRARDELSKAFLDPAHRAMTITRSSGRVGDLLMVDMAEAEIRSSLRAQLKTVSDALGQLPSSAAVTALRDQIKAVSDAQGALASKTSVTALTDRLVAAEARLAALEAKRQHLAGRNISLPLLAIGSTDITVSWGQNLGDASYQVALIPSANVPAAVTLTVKTTYATSCIVTARTTLAIPLGATFDAIAYRA